MPPNRIGDIVYLLVFIHLSLARQENDTTRTPLPNTTVPETDSTNTADGRTTLEKPQSTPRLVVSVQRHSNRIPRAANNSFPVEGFDCAKPRNFEPVQSFGPDSICDENEHDPLRATDQVFTNFTVLQRADNIRSKARRCYVTESNIALYCGAFDHQTLAAPLLEIQRPKEISGEACKDLWRTRKWTDPQGRVHKLDLEVTNHIYYTHRGSVTMDKWHTGCTGGTITTKDGKSLNRMFVGRYRDITLSEMEITIDNEGGVMVYMTQTRLPTPECHAKHLSCIVRSGTYNWHPLSRSESCMLYAVRNSTGSVVTASSGQNVFMSTDQSMIRLLVGPETTKCGIAVHPTDHSRIFLTNSPDQSLFLRPLHPSEMSVITYSNAKDSWLFGKLTANIEDELRKVLKNSCKHMSSTAALQFGRQSVAQSAASGGTTSRLKDNWFTTTAGDAWYRYQCRRLHVEARDTNGTCYDSLPITLSKRDLLTYQLDRNLTVMEMTGLEFFIDPHTHLISTRGIPRDCEDDFDAIYKGRNGTWIRHGRHLTKIPPPLLLMPDSVPLPVDDSPLPEFGKGGIYTPDKVRSMEKHRQAPRAITDVVTQLGRRAMLNHWQGTPDSYPTPGDILDGASGLDFYNSFWTKVAYFGHFSAIFVVLGCVFRFCSWIAGMGLRFFNHDERGRGFWRRMKSALFPSWSSYKSGLKRYQERKAATKMAAEQQRLVEQRELAIRRYINNHHTLTTAFPPPTAARTLTPKSALMPPDILAPTPFLMPSSIPSSLNSSGCEFRPLVAKAQVHLQASAPDLTPSPDSPDDLLPSTEDLLPSSSGLYPPVPTPQTPTRRSTFPAAGRPPISLLAMKSLLTSHLQLASHSHDTQIILMNLLVRANHIVQDTHDLPPTAPAAEHRILHDRITALRFDVLAVSDLFRPPTPPSPSTAP